MGWLRTHAALPSYSYVTFSGHSRGGAIAQILGVLYQGHRRATSSSPPFHVVTLGAPPVIGPASVDDLADFPLLRITHGNDIVPNAATTYYHTREALHFHPNEPG